MPSSASPGPARESLGRIATLRQIEAAIDSSDLVRQFEAIEQSAK